MIFLPEAETSFLLERLNICWQMLQREKKDMGSSFNLHLQRALLESIESEHEHHLASFLFPCDKLTLSVHDMLRVYFSNVLRKKAVL